MNSPSEKQILDYVKTYLAQQGGTIDQDSIEEALAHFVSNQMTLGKYSSDGTNILNQLRANLLQQSSPGVETFISVSKQQYLSQGLSEEDATTNANNDALNQIDDNLSENEVATPAFTGGPAVNKAVIKALSKNMPDIDPDTADQVSQGLVDATNMFSAAGTYFNNISTVTPTPDNTLTGTQGAAALNNITNAANQLLPATAALLASLKLPPSDQVSLQGYLLAMRVYLVQLNNF